MNASISSNLTYINWIIESDGGLNLTKLLLEWSSDFSNDSISPYFKCN